MPSHPRNVSIDEAIASFSRIQPVRPRAMPLTEAIGLRLAEDVVARRPVPAEPTAVGNGYAVAASATAGATARRPRKLGLEAHPVETGMVMPAGTDAVLPLERSIRGAKGFSATRPVSPGDGVSAPGSVAEPGDVIAKEGSRITFGIAMSCASCGVTDVQVRSPVVDIVFNSPGFPRPGDQYVGMICSAIRGSGSQIGTLTYAGGDAAVLRSALAGNSADIVTVIGGMGDGQGDTTMAVIAEIGEVLFRGVRLQPGGTIGFGFVEGKPVFASPGRLPDMLAANIVLSWPFARRAFGRPPFEPSMAQAVLTAAIPAPTDRARLVFLRHEKGEATPLLADELSPRDIALANATLFLPEGSKGLKSGQSVQVYRIGITM
jgi:molybdopterin molybdotransferase